MQSPFLLIRAYARLYSFGGGVLSLILRSISVGNFFLKVIFLSSIVEGRSYVFGPGFYF